MPANQRFSTALVTGASSGLGEEFALQIAPRVGRLVLVARREPLLQQLASRIRRQCPDVEVVVFEVDLTRETERCRLVENLSQRGFQPDLLINNAGLGDYGEFATADWGKLRDMLRVNVEAVTHLAHLLAPAMIRARRGAIVNLSSLASLLPIPDFAVYAATKAYVTSFSEALRIELKEHGIPVLAVCPGPVKTEFGEVSRRSPDSPVMPANRLFYVPRERVVAEALAALERKSARVFPGWQIAAAALLISAVPICALRLAMGFRPRR